MHKLSGGRLSTVAVWAAAALAISGAGCSSKKGGSSSGTARIAISSAALSADVAEIVVTVSPGDGPSFTPFQASLSKSADGWHAFITGVPVGPGRLFEVVAYDANHQQLYSGSAKADIVAGQPALVVVGLGGSPTDPYHNNAPVIDFVSASSTAVPPGATVRLGISAHDPDAGDSVSFLWAASCGTFDDASKTNVTWTAPGSAQHCQITATASDNRGASVSVYLAIEVAAGTGDVLVEVGQNTSPVISGMTANVRFRDPVQGELTVAAVDPDGDTLAYAWTSSCTALSFESPAAASTNFSNSDGSRACVATVTVTDGKGGQVIGAVTIPPSIQFNLGPVISHTVQPNVDTSDPRLAEPVQGGDAVPLEVDAYDPENGQLTFTWTATAGTFSDQTDVRTSPGKSTVIFHVPATVPVNLTVNVTVADPVNNSTSHDFLFKLSGAPSPCAGKNDGDSCDDGNPCNQTDTCQGGVCVGSNPVVCAPPVPCKQAGVCQVTGPSAGTCTYADAATATTCDDGRACTSPDACAAGVCVPGPSTCPTGQTCDSSGTCTSTCTPDCATSNRVCGTDGCGGSCGTCTTGTCNETTGQCDTTCTPNCATANRVCGADGCGGSCGTCTTGTCDETTGQCACTPNCAGKVCGPDGCNGSCGTCSSGTCNNATGQCSVTATTVVPVRADDLRIIAPGWVALDAAGNSFVAGDYASIQPINFQTRAGGTPAISLTSQGGLDAFVAKYDSTGEITSAILVGDDSAANPTDQQFTGVAAAAGGRIGMIGKFAGAVTYPVGGVLSAASLTPVVVAHNNDGTKAWGNMYTMGGNGLFQSVAANKTALTPAGTADRIAACGFTDGTSSLGTLEGVQGTQNATIGAWNAATGAKLWGRVIGTATGSAGSNVNCAAVTVDANGDVVATGQFDSASVDFGGGLPGFVVAGPGSTTQKYMWVAKFNGATGATLSLRVFQPAATKTGSADPRAITIGPSGNIAIGGGFTGSLSIGAEIVSAGSTDAFIAQLTPSFAPAWNALRIGGTASDLVRSVQFTSLGDIVALGQFGASSAALKTANGGADTNGNPVGSSVLAPPNGTGATPLPPLLTSLGGTDAMVLKINGSTGAYDSDISYGNAATQSGDSLSVNRFGTGALKDGITFTSSSPGSVTYAPGVIYTSTGATDVALVFASLQ